MRTETDLLVYKIMDALDKIDPDEDPGDISIMWQDDSRLVTAQQKEFVGIGCSAQEALMNLAQQRGLDATI